MGFIYKKKLIVVLLSTFLLILGLSVIGPRIAYAATTEDGLFEYSIESGQVAITKYLGSQANVVIPETIEGFPVTEVKNAAFMNNTSIESVTAQSVVKLTAVRTSWGITTLSTYNGCFEGCTALTTVTMPNLEIVGEDSFRSCAMESITLEKVTSLHQSAFRECKSLKNVELNSVTSVATYAFAYCDSITSLAFPNLDSISQGRVTDGYYSYNCGAFAYMPNLKYINLGNLSYLPKNIFNNCPRLETIDALYLVSGTWSDLSNRQTEYEKLPALSEVRVYCDSPLDFAEIVKVHDWENVIINEATCTTNGTGSKQCKTCGTEQELTLLATGHTFALEYTTDEEPNCTQNGSMSRHCANCEEKTDIKEILALGHKWDEGKVTTPPTAAANGVKTYNCVQCGAIRTESIQKLAEDELVDIPKTGDHSMLGLWLLGSSVSAIGVFLTFVISRFAKRKRNDA